MRISGGESRGQRLKPPRHKGLRPTSDKVREALFSILGSRVPGSRLLELFAGTGAVGIEAMSRGAARAVFVDSSAKASRLIGENLTTLGYREKGAVVTKDVMMFLKKTAYELGPFDIVFIDPPYHQDTGIKTLALLAEPGGDEAPDYLARDAVVVFEHFKKYPAPEKVGRLVKKKDYVYGDTVLSVYNLS